MTELPLAPAPTNRRKWIFVGIVGLCAVIILSVAILMMRGGDAVGAKGFSPKSKEVVFWTFDMDTRVFESLEKKFGDFVGRSDIKVRVKNFDSYEDYLESLPRAILAGKSPDILMAMNHGGYRVLDQYASAVGGNIVDFNDFEARFHPLFVDELVFEEKQTVDGTDKIVQGLRGIPVGFEPLGIYYNRSLTDTAPTRWDQEASVTPASIDRRSRIAERTGDSALSVTTSTPITQPVPVWSLGDGHATPTSADIIPLLMLQTSESTTASYEGMDAVSGRAAIELYRSYRSQTTSESDLNAADRFVRGTSATLIGYPSTLRDIMMAIQRAKDADALLPDFEKNLRWSTIPQQSSDPKKQINIADYRYFVLAKDGEHRDESAKNDPVIKMMQFLTTSAAQDVFAGSQDYILPAEKRLLKSGDTKINPEKSVNMTINDWYDEAQSFILYDMGIPHLFRSIMKQSLDEPGTTPTIIGSSVATYMKCKIKSLTDPLLAPGNCTCRTVMPENNSTYWPFCGQK